MKPKNEEVQKLIDSLIEGLSYASYDINPIVNRPVDLELMLKIQEVVISDINSLTEIAKNINMSFAEIFNPPIKPLPDLSNPEILAEIEHIKQQVDIISERRLNLEREMFFRNNPDVNP